MSNQVYQFDAHENLRRIKKDLGELGLSFKPQIAKCEIEVQECPYCHGDVSKADNQYKLNINYEKLVYHCHRCGASGTYYQFKEQQGLKSAARKTAVQKPLEIHERLWIEAIDISTAEAEPARKYFESRGLSVPNTQRIKFLTSAKYFEDGIHIGSYAAIISRVEDNSGQFVAVHVIYLDSTGGKAPVKSPKKMMGKIGGGSVSFGDSSTVIAVAEGIETSLAVHEATKLTTYSCLSANGLKKFEPLAGVKAVFIFADNDVSKTGQRAAFDLATRLYRKKIEVYVLIPDRDYFDVWGGSSFDYLDVFNKEKDFMSAMIKSVVPFDPDRDLWIQPMRKEAFHGIVGRFIDRIFEFTEADKNALCIQFLLLFGSMVGRKPYFQISSDKHFPNLFAVIVGETSIGRKGTGLSNSKAFFRLFAEEFVKMNVSDGLATGEGVIHRLRDKVEEEVIDDKVQVKAGEQPIKKKRVVDQGVEDKRLLISEPEFVQVLNASSRQGNILSGVIRKLWDCDTLSNLSKGAAQTATDPYVSIIGQITPAELRKTINEVDFSNGLGNRFMWALSRNSKLIPFPPDLSKVDMSSLAAEAREALFHSQRVGPMTFSDEAKQLWEMNYIRRHQKLSGVLGSLTARYAAQVLRLAIVYSLLDCKSVIEIAHLKAAYAVWDYCQDSTAFLFGGISDDPVARKILYHLEKSELGLTRTEIRDIFSGHKSSDEIENALRYLKDENLVDSRTEATKGRPTERWYAV